MAVQRTLSKPAHTHDQLHNRQHPVTSGQDHTFPGGTSMFLRADGTFATPPAQEIGQQAIDSSIATHDTTSSSHADKVTTIGSATNRISNPSHPRPAGVAQCIWFVTEGLFPTNAALGDDIDDGTEPFNPDVISDLMQDHVELEARVNDIETSRLRSWVGTLTEYNALPTPRPTDTAHYILADTP
jgi:hypothetical protein